MNIELGVAKFAKQLFYLRLASAVNLPAIHLVGFLFLRKEVK